MRLTTTLELLNTFLAEYSACRFGAEARLLAQFRYVRRSSLKHWMNEASRPCNLCGVSVAECARARTGKLSETLAVPEGRLAESVPIQRKFSHESASGIRGGKE